MGRLGAIALLLSAIAAPAVAQQASSNVTASNGVAVHVIGDDFAQRYEYTAPAIKLPDGGLFMVASVKRQGAASPVMIQGFLFYAGEWRFYDQALFRGGDVVPATFNDRKVVTCAGARYGGGCTHSEGFDLRPTPEQVAKYASGAWLEIQLRARGLNPVMLSVPVAHIDAIREVAGVANVPAAGAPAVPPIAKPAAPAAVGAKPKPKSPAVLCVTC